MRNGMHWRDIQDPEFRNLAMWSAYDDEPDMVDAETEHDGSITVVFGSKPGNLTLKFVDSEAINMFNYGNCAAFAYVLNQKTGLPFVVFTSDTSTVDDWHGHVGVLVAPGEILDVAGVRTFAEVQNDYRIGSEPVVVDEKGFVERIVAPEHQHDVLSYVGVLERYVLNDFVDFTIETYLK